MEYKEIDFYVCICLLLFTVPIRTIGIVVDQPIGAL
jgi:hypothetical protein